MLKSIICDIFKKYLTRIAISFDGKDITYGELELIVNNISDNISSYTKGINYPIAFNLNKGYMQIATMLGIICANCYYVPIDPNYPEERINFIIKDSAPRLIITEYGIKSSNNIISNNLENVAYIIYTSGTTGMPKGVIIKQSSVINLIESAIKICNITIDSKILHYTSIGFDAAGWDIYIALFSGGTLCILPDEGVINPPFCHEYMIDNKITMATFTPAFLSQMPLLPIKSLKTLVIMGDISDSKFMDWWTLSTTVFNGYGPTECTIGSTIHKYSVGDNINNIGKPFNGYSTHIIDGELYIAGEGLAIGYHNLDKLTKKKFVDTEYGRAYRTGDYAKMLDNGDIEFIGRIDNQIKINGIRIELEEIDSIAMKLPFIERACSILHNDRIYLFYQSNTPINNDLILNHMKMYLHRCVVPKYYYHMNKFTLTPNGKINRNDLICSLPRHSKNVPVNQTKFVLPK